MPCYLKIVTCLIFILALSIITNPLMAQTPETTTTPVSPTNTSSDKPEKPTTLETETDTLIDQLLNDNPLVVEEARNELLEIGKRAVPALIMALENEKPRLRYMVCEILTEIRDERALPVFIKLLTDKEEIGNSIASLAAKGLGKLGDSTAITPLVSSLPTPDVELRYEVINALGILRAEQAIPLLLSAITDTAKTYSDYLVKCAAIEALGKLKSKDAVKRLINMLSDTETEPATDAPVLHYAIKALEKITDTSFGQILFNDKKKEKEIVKQWQDWWEKNKFSYGEVPPPPPEPPKQPEILKLPEQPKTPENPPTPPPPKNEQDKPEEKKDTPEQPKNQ
ncbi:MAG: HEAT repeat domain-containing protein [Planctomycetes bacterium]|nr:HEAT repeat domain-containing protein [Planctomycetota bacterium]